MKMIFFRQLVTELKKFANFFGSFSWKRKTFRKGNF